MIKIKNTKIKSSEKFIKTYAKKQEYIGKNILCFKIKYVFLIRKQMILYYF